MSELGLNNITGYIEGYYGKLFSWKERKKIIQTLSKIGQSHYFLHQKRSHFIENDGESWDQKFF